MCYTWTKNWTTYYNAEKACKQKGGHLATIHNAEENGYLSELLANEDSHFYWIGLYNEEFQWKWEDGSPVNYLNWAKGQPGEKYMYCGSLRRSDKTWWNFKCGGELSFICLIPAV